MKQYHRSDEVLTRTPLSANTFFVLSKRSFLNKKLLNLWPAAMYSLQAVNWIITDSCFVYSTSSNDFKVESNCNSSCRVFILLKQHVCVNIYQMPCIHWFLVGSKVNALVSVVWYSSWKHGPQSSAGSAYKSKTGAVLLFLEPINQNRFQGPPHAPFRFLNVWSLMTIMLEYNI